MQENEKMDADLDEMQDGVRQIEPNLPHGGRQKCVMEM